MVLVRIVSFWQIGTLPEIHQTVCLRRLECVIIRGMFKNLWRAVFGDVQTDLGNLEGDYRVSQLKSDITQSLLNFFIVSVSVLAMLRVDAILFADKPKLFMYMAFYRLFYLLVTAAFGYALYKTAKVRIFDRLVYGWTFFTIIFMLLFAFTRPINYISSSIDIIIPFVIYILSPLKFKQTVLLALLFSVGTLYMYYFVKVGVDPITLSVATSAQFIAHVMGITAGAQIQSYRRKSYQAFIDEKDAKEMVAYLANIDQLTKSLTRRQLLNIAESEFRRYVRYKRPLSILILDADRFKTINDTYGHHAGDLVLRSLSLVAMEQKRAQDTFGRLGGEEFGLLMPETTLDNALLVAERIRKTWEQSPVTLDGELIHSTISIGAAEVSPDDQSLEDILRRADRMLYKAKDAGRNRVNAN
jgi:diguanylate cyclase (GGDEF)-like protein